MYACHPMHKMSKGQDKFFSNIVEIRIATQHRRTCDAMRPENDTNEIVSLISPIIRLNGSIATCSDNSSCVSLNISTSLCKSCKNSNKIDKVGLMQYHEVFHCTLFNRFSLIVSTPIRKTIRIFHSKAVNDPIPSKSIVHKADAGIQLSHSNLALDPLLMGQAA